MKIKPNFIIAGCARSGTKYISVVLSKLGIPCSHEAYTTDGKKGKWQHKAKVMQKLCYWGDASWMIAPNIHKFLSNTIVFHQLRNPVHVIRSMMGYHMLGTGRGKYNGRTKYANYALTAGSIGNGKEIRQCMDYWLHWNDMIRQQLDDWPLTFQYKVEDLTSNRLRYIASLLGKTATFNECDEVLKAVSKSTHHRRRAKKVCWSSLPEGMSKDLLKKEANWYGYGLEELMSA